MTTAKDLPDPATRKRILAAMKRRDWDLVNAIVEGYPIVRRALARRESYALIERREPKQSAKDPVGWVAVETNARFVNGIVRFVKELGIHGDYRIVSVKRRVRIASDGAEPVVELAVPRSKPLYELERWCGSPTPGKRGAWKRLPFPTDWRKRRGVGWSEWILEHGPPEDWKDAMAFLHEHRRQGSYRVITVKAHVSLDTDDGEDRIWWGHCMAPDDGWRSKLYCYSSQ